MNELNQLELEMPNVPGKWAAAHDQPLKPENPAAPLDRLVLHPSDSEIFVPAVQGTPFNVTTINDELMGIPRGKSCDGIDLQILIRGDLHRQNVMVIDKKTGKQINGIEKCVIDLDAARRWQSVTLKLNHASILGLVNLYGPMTVDGNNVTFESDTDLLESRKTFVVDTF